MHVITFAEPITVSRGYQLPAGTYLADNVNCGDWLGKHSHQARIEGHPELPAWSPAAKRVCVVRPGGLGDLVMLTAIFREMARVAPEARLTVCTYPWNACVLEGLPYVHETIDYPLPRERWLDFDAIVGLDDLLERHSTPAKTHALDAMLPAFPGLVVANRRPDYRLRGEEKLMALDKWDRPTREKDGLVVGYQLQASAKARTYPREQELLRGLIDRGHGIRVFGEPGRKHVEHAWGNRLHDLAAGEPCGRAPNFRESVALAADCDVLIAPDSSLVHIAGAVGIPCVALYGSFEAHTRMAYYPTVHALQGRRPCAPCCWHSRTGHWPKQKDAECLTAGHCTALAAIEPKQIISRAEREAKLRITL